MNGGTLGAVNAARPRILVVDDDLDARVILEGFLEASGYQVSVAKDGREALALLSGGIAADVIVLDLMMPHMNGQQLLAQLRGGRPEWRALPVVVVTAAPEQVPEAAAVFSKPASLDALLAAIDRLLGPRAPTNRKNARN